MDPSGAGAGGSRRRAEQCLSVAEKLLVARDLEGCKQFASQALAADPHTPGADGLHAAAATLLAAQRCRLPSGQPDPYGILGLDPSNPGSRRPDAIHSHYLRLSFLLNRSHPNRTCSLAFGEAARLVADAWAFLSDPGLKSALDGELDAAAAARAYHSPAPNLPQQHSQSPPPARRTPTPAAPSPPSTTPPAAATQRLTQPPAAPSPRPTPPLVSPPLRPTPPPVASPPRPVQRPVVSQTRPTPPPVAPAPRSTPPPPVAPQTRPTPPSAAPAPRLTPPPLVTPRSLRSTLPPSAPQTPIAATAPAVQSDGSPSPTFWTVCSACCHIHQYDRQYETRKLMCPSCRQPFVAKAMADPPPIVPGTDMYYCTWGFFPVGFPGCPGFEKMVNSQPREPDQLKAPWLTTDGVKGNSQNGVPPVSAPVVEVPVEVPIEVPAVTPPAKPVRMKVGAKKRGRPKGSKNKKKL
ncbi:hypothetical protein BS78_02G208500 [Paspalum vaginatum]|nr:hypothetical protein BS78_02G208500 [Paspalum vaginatum]